MNILFRNEFLHLDEDKLALPKHCPVHSAPIIYDDASMVRMASNEGELRRRNVVTCLNLLLKNPPREMCSKSSGGYLPFKADYHLYYNATKRLWQGGNS